MLNEAFGLPSSLGAVKFPLWGLNTFSLYLFILIAGSIFNVAAIIAFVIFLFLAIFSSVARFSLVFAGVYA